MSIIIPITFTTPNITLTWANKENPDATVDLIFYEVEVWEIDSNENPLNLKHSYEITPATPSLDGSWAFTLADNSSIFGTVTRKFMVKIFSKDTNGDVCPDPATLILNNPAPIAPKTVSITSGNEVNYINITPSDDTDIVGYVICRNTTSGFTPNDTNKVYEGVNTQVTLSSLAGTIYYYRIGQYDEYGKIGMIYSQEYIAAVPDNLPSYVSNDGGTPSITQGITTDLPTAGTIGRLFLDTITKLWKRDNGTTWDTIGGGVDFLAWANTFLTSTTKILGFNNIAPTTTKGDLIVFDGSNNVRVPVGTNSQTLVADSTQSLGIKWADASSGGGGGETTTLSYPDLPPNSPSEWDDEFDSTTLNSSWTLNGSDNDHQAWGSTGYFDVTSYDVNTSQPSWFQAKIVQSSSQKGWSLLKDFAPGTGAVSVTAKFSGYYLGNYGGTNIYIGDSTFNNFVRGAVFFSSGYVATPLLNSGFSKRVSGTTTYDVFHSPFISTGLQFIHLQRDTSNNWSLYVSNTGHSWLLIGIVNINFTVAKLNINCCLDGEVVTRQLGCDWIRVNWLFL